MTRTRGIGTLHRLQAAALELAATTPAQDLAVAQVCRAAGITRDTFYRYAPSPAALVAGVFDEELAELDRMVAGGDGDERSAPDWDAPTRLWLAHVERHAPVYRTSLAPHLPLELREPLISHLSSWLISHLRRFPVLVPQICGRPATEEEIFLVATYAVSGAVGIVERELATGADFEPERLRRIIFTVSADWWFGPDGAARPRL